MEALFTAMAKDIEVSNIKGTDMYSRIVSSKLQQLFRASGLPHKSKAYLWAQLRNRFPGVCRMAKATDGRDHLRILWTTVDNLNLWHIGCVKFFFVGCCALIIGITATVVVVLILVRFTGTYTCIGVADVVAIAYVYICV